MLTVIKPKVSLWRVSFFSPEEGGVFFKHLSHPHRPSLLYLMNVFAINKVLNASQKLQTRSNFYERTY